MGVKIHSRHPCIATQTVVNYTAHVQCVHEAVCVSSGNR
jgi:hypothetical protein